MFIVLVEVEILHFDFVTRYPVTPRLKGHVIRWVGGYRIHIGIDEMRETADGWNVLGPKIGKPNTGSVLFRMDETYEISKSPNIETIKPRVDFWVVPLHS